jgi:hypothetical protein
VLILTGTWQTSSSLTTMPGLTRACAHVRQTQKWNGLFFPVLPTAQTWHRLTTTCLALWRMHYVGAILQVITYWSKVFAVCSEVEAGNFITMMYSVLLSVGKSVLRMTKTLWKNSLIFAKVYESPM